MTYIGIGLIVGIIMGLTGAGGALVSIPLFLHLLGLTLKEATTLSLIAVLFGTSINLVGQFSKIDLRITLPLSLAGIMANAGTLFIKPLAPEILVAALLISIALYSLWGVWNSPKHEVKKIDNKGIIHKAIVAGAILGLLTTLTGLGGGVILLPLLLKIFGKTYKEALPTSLGSILIISLSSFLFQSRIALNLINGIQLIYLAVGTLVAYFLLKVILSKITKTQTDLMRKIVFSIVTIYSAISVILKSI